MSNLRNQIAEQKNDLREVAEDLAERIKDILQPAPSPKRAVKIGTSIGALMLLAVIARFIYEVMQVPTYKESTDG